MMSPDPAADSQFTRPSAPGPGADSGGSDTADATRVRTRARTPGVETAVLPGLLAVPGYTVTRLIARGGMGAVYAARDLTLDRDVAIKTLLPGADSARFVTEAQITGRLTHPNVPPVYALGTLPDGGQFLVMKLVHGHTLADLIKKRPVAADLPRLTQAFEQIAQAVGFAHSRGVIHRDLKPLNVMVGEFGEVQVMDWGLAREGAASDTTADEAETRPGASELTRAGAVMGTPGYMAPEQARGEPVDARADVFALGAMLAAILTGQPAFVGSTADETVEKAAAADLGDVFARLGACGADPELVTLARRCLAASAADRPGDAQEVAAEIGAYRAGVEARLRQAETGRARAETQAAEQRKRRRVVQWAAGAVAAVLLLGIAGTAVGLVRAEYKRVEAEEARQREKARADGEEAAKREAEQARDKEAEARTAAVAAKTRAEEAEGESADVIDAMVSEVTGKSLETQKAISAEQKKFLTEKALPLYQKFAAGRGNDEKSRARVARAALRAGIIEYRLGRNQEGAAAFETARAEYARLAAEFPAVPEYRRELARSYNNLGAMAQKVGQMAEAEGQISRAGTIQEKLAAEFPAVPDYRSELARSYSNLGVLLRGLGKLAEAEGQFRKALAVREKLAAEVPTAPDYRSELAYLHQLLGALLKDRGQMAEAERQMNRAVTIQERLAAEVPAVPEYRSALADGHNEFGALLVDLGRRAGAEEQYRKALAIREKLAADFPSVPAYRSELATSHFNLGAMLEGLRRLAEAEAQFSKALVIREKLAADFPTVPTYRSELAGCHHCLGVLAYHLGNRAEAVGQFSKALAIQEKLAADFPTVPMYRSGLARSHDNLGAVLTELGKLAEAAGQFSKALAIREKLAAEVPTVPDYRSDLGASHNNLGLFLKSLGKRPEAEEQHRKAVALFEKLAAEFPAVPDYRSDLGASHDNLGLLLADLGKLPEAEEQYRKALALTEKLAADFPTVPTYRRDLARQWYNLACLHAIVSGKAPEKKAEHADRAIESLRHAVTAGYRDAAHMKADPDLEPLRARPDFKALLADLEKKFPPPLPAAPPPREKK